MLDDNDDDFEGDLFKALLNKTKNVNVDIVPTESTTMTTTTEEENQKATATKPKTTTTKFNEAQAEFDEDENDDEDDENEFEDFRIDDDAERDTMECMQELEQANSIENLSMRNRELKSELLDKVENVFDKYQALKEELELVRQSEEELRKINSLYEKTLKSLMEKLKRE